MICSLVTSDDHDCIATMCKHTGKKPRKGKGKSKKEKKEKLEETTEQKEAREAKDKARKEASEAKKVPWLSLSVSKLMPGPFLECLNLKLCFLLG